MAADALLGGRLVVEGLAERVEMVERPGAQSVEAHDVVARGFLGEDARADLRVAQPGDSFRQREPADRVVRRP